MSALAWLFGLGALAVAFPILFHLIRRTPKGQTEFSSLMFLKPTPPSLTRRSRIENILLLLMRVAAVCLIAFAFMRPFFRGTDTLSEVDVASRRIAILLDTSASMRRSGIWEKAQQHVDQVLSGLEKGDDVALLAFDRSVKPVVPFNDGAETEAVDRTELVRAALKSLEPSWSRSDLGRALVSVADSLDLWRDSQRDDEGVESAKLQIVVISDLQHGSKVEALQSYQWPGHVFVKFRDVVPNDYSNATVQLLNAAAEEEDPAVRIRVANSDESTVEQFFVHGETESGTQNAEPVSFYVPAGTSRVIKVPPADAVDVQQFVVSGDGEDFDNTFFVVPAKKQQLNVVYLGDDEKDDPEKPLYYLRRALVETPTRTIKLRHVVADESIADPGDSNRPTLVVLASAVDEPQAKQIDAYLESGGTLLVVLSDDETVANTDAWIGASLQDVASESEQQSSKSEYMMLAEIDFSDPLFRAFANPRYNDFTKIRFWQHQPVELNDEDANVVARFENDDPAIWHRISKGGQVFVFASGWQPTQSQLALSTKFVPLINGLIEIAAEIPELNQSLLVDDPIEFPPAENGSLRTMIKPDGSRESIEPDQTRFVAADQPGIYRLKSQAAVSGRQPASETESSSAAANPLVTSFAVNVDRAESETAAIPVEQLEMFEVKVGEQETATTDLAQMRELRDKDIENRQKFWKWLIVAAIILLIGETWLAGRTASQMIASDSAAEPPKGLSGEMI